MTERERFVAMVRARRAMRLTTPRRRLPRQIPPDTIAREYARRLLGVVERVREALAPLFAELPGLLASAARARGDADEGRRIRELLEGATARVTSTIRQTDIERMAREVAARTSAHNREQLNRQVRSAFGVDVFMADARMPALVDGFVAENVALIKDLPGTVMREIEQRVTRAVTNAVPHPQLATDLDERFSIGRNRAKLIARDQVGKLYGQINAARQRDIGAEAFIWRTVRDRRVRGTPGGAFPDASPSHYAREGQRFRFDDPLFKNSGDGIPGVPIQCRCYAEPDFSALLDEVAEPAPRDLAR